MHIDRWGEIETSSLTLTASSANYMPRSGGLDVSDCTSFGYDIVCAETTGNDPGVTVTLEVSMDGDNWLAYSQPIFYPINGAAAASITIADENHYMGSVHPMPCKFVRFVVTETAGDADNVTTLITMKQ